MALNIADLAEHAIDAVPDRVALICGDEQITYAQLEEKANRLAHYLIDHGASSVTPYFGIAYYKGDQRRVTTAKLIQALLRTLGPTYKSTPKNDYVTFIAAANLTEVDDEQDPKNLCKQPRQHRFVGIVQAHKDKPNKPEYLILANVKNLCDFGDRLAKRLVQ